jgi:hypothetical protein
VTESEKHSSFLPYGIKCAGKKVFKAKAIDVNVIKLVFNTERGAK